MKKLIIYLGSVIIFIPALIIVIMSSTLKISNDSEGLVKEGFTPKIVEFQHFGICLKII